MSTHTNDSPVVLEEFGDKGVITLNRPKALNALNLDMVRIIYPKLQQWEKEKNLVIIKGSGDKAFCAGGDVVAVTDGGKRGDPITRDFFKEEYMLNHLIGSYHIPYVALINGITMGGGVGLSVHGTYRIATEKTLFAMPETSIGLFTDVGGGYFLPRLGGNLGLFLSLTGFRLKGRDNVKAGIATHFCDASKVPKLEEELLALKSPYPEDIRRVIETFHSTSVVDADKEFSLANHMSLISSCFKGDSIEEVIDNLKKEGSEWSLKHVSTLEKCSPISLKITLELLKRGKELNMADCLQLEYRCSQRCCEDNDFYEGIRALLKDKDNNPQWNPSRLQDVGKDVIDRYFSPLPDGRDLSL